MIDSSSERYPLEVLADEFAERWRRGERPTVTEYTARHPDLAGEIRALFPAVVLMEDVKRSRPMGASAAHSVPARMPERLGDCRVVREVGRGGMGIVYEAEQESLGRRVAVKVLTAQALVDPDRLRRFRREARAMARLHHTNIVPVFGFGEHDGLPYYIMQFIDGQGLDQLIADSTGLPFGEVARVGLQVAEALAYAHAQGTLHRDIKPSNLLLDGRGTVWITDFGLAQLAESENASEPGALTGTLRYMAPERFRGRSDARCDVYGLGLTLYELLTLRPAFDATDRGQLIHQVTHEEPPAPRRSNPAIPRDLETVVLKACARDPVDRYQSAQELAADLRRFLEGKAVRARRVGPAEHLRRWCVRNPAVAGLTALAAGLLVLAAGLASAGYLQTRSALRREGALRQEAEAQRRQAEVNVELARTAVAREADQRQEAVDQRQRAEANLRLALRAFDEVFAQAARHDTVHASDPASDEESELACPPVVSPEVAALLNNLLKFYDQFGERNGSDSRLQGEIARAYRRVGDIQQRLGQFEKAETAYRRALVLYEQRASCPRETAVVQNELGLVLQMTGRFAEAEKAHRRALERLQVRVAGDTGPAPVRYELARTHALLGGVLGNTGRSDEAVASYHRSLALVTYLLEEDSANPDYRLVQARTYRSLYFVLSRRGKRPEAATACREAIALLTKLADDYPAVPDYRYELGEVLIRLSGGGRGSRHDPGAEPQLRRAVDLAKDLVVAFPAVPQYQALRARAFHKLGSLLQVSGRATEAEHFHREAVALHRTLVSQFPSVPSYQLYRAEACRSLGTDLRQQGQLAEACSVLEEAIEAQQAFLKAAPEMRHGRSQLAREYQTLAETLRQLGDTVRSREVARLAREAKKRP
jgi:tetratricopeptide (TPR) repeat protein